MGYYLRVLARSAEGIPRSQLQRRLGEDGIRAVLEDEASESADWTRLFLKHPDGTPIADVERNDVNPGSLGFRELQEFSDEVEDCKPISAAGWLRSFFKSVKTIYAFQVLSGADKGRGWDAIWAVECELWGTLGGILQSDAEGFTNEDGYHILWQFANVARGPWKMAVLGTDGRWTAFEMDLGNRDHRAAFLNGQVPAGAKQL
jgi:hypothetical protein